MGIVSIGYAQEISENNWQMLYWNLQNDITDSAESFSDAQRARVLLEAVKRDHVKVIRRVLNLPTNPNLQDKNGRTPLLIASDHCHTEIVELLLNKGANPNIPDNWGWNPLPLAIATCYKNRTAIVDLLLEKQADVNSINHWGSTSFSLAVNRNLYDTAHLLFEKTISFDNYDDTLIQSIREAMIENASKQAAPFWSWILPNSVNSEDWALFLEEFDNRINSERSNLGIEL